MMSEFVTTASPANLRTQGTRAARPAHRSTKYKFMDDQTKPSWPGRVSSNGDGTYALTLSSYDPQIAVIEAVLREQTCIKTFSYNIRSVHKPSIPGLKEVCAGIRQNRGLQVFKVFDMTSAPAIANPDEWFEFCNAVHDHPTLTELKMPMGVFVHGDALNKELQNDHSKLKQLRISLPESQQQLDAFSEALENNHGLTTLTLTLTAQSAANHERLAKALANHRSLLTLDLDLADATSDCQALFGGLAAAPALQALTVTEFSDRQAIGLRDFLSNNPRIQQLDLARPQLSDEGSVHVAAGIDRNLSIRKFTLYKEASADSATRIQQAIDRAQRRYALLQESALVGHGISAGMAYAPSPYRELVLPPEVGALVAEAVAVHLDPNDADRVYRTLSL